jgi:hypothetical protein
MLSEVEYPQDNPAQSKHPYRRHYPVFPCVLSVVKWF